MINDHDNDNNQHDGNANKQFVITTGCLLINNHHDGALMMMINDHDNNQHDDNADKQFVMISSLFDLLVFAFQSHVDAFE